MSVHVHVVMYDVSHELDMACHMLIHVSMLPEKEIQQFKV